jgi:Flp pilus assembly protein TadG
MTLPKLTNRQPLARFTSDVRGIAAVEFALIVPVLLLMMLGSIEIGRAVVMARKFNYITAMASDLIARETTMSDAALTGVATAVQTAWAPNTLATLRIEVVAARSAGAASTSPAPGSTYVDWSFGLIGTGPRAQCSAYSTPANMLAVGSSTIFVNATFTYTSLFGAAVPGMSASMPWTASSAHAPRNLCVQRPPRTNCLSQCET